MQNINPGSFYTTESSGLGRAGQCGVAGKAEKAEKASLV